MFLRHDADVSTRSLRVARTGSFCPTVGPWSAGRDDVQSNEVVQGLRQGRGVGFLPPCFCHPRYQGGFVPLLLGALVAVGEVQRILVVPTFCKGEPNSALFLHWRR